MSLSLSPCAPESRVGSLVTFCFGGICGEAKIIYTGIFHTLPDPSWYWEYFFSKGKPLLALKSTFYETCNLKVTLWFLLRPSKFNFIHLGGARDWSSLLNETFWYQNKNFWSKFEFNFFTPSSLQGVSKTQIFESWLWFLGCNTKLIKQKKRTKSKDDQFTYLTHWVSYSLFSRSR